MEDHRKHGAAPAGAVAGLADVLAALGEELREANRRVRDGRPAILFSTSATVELAVTTSISAGGGLKVWVVNAETGADYERAGRVTVNLAIKAGDDESGLGVGM